MHVATIYAAIKSQVPLHTVAKHRMCKTKATLPTCSVIIRAQLAIHVEMLTE